MAKCYLWKCNRPAADGHAICAVHFSRVDPKTRAAVSGPMRTQPGSDEWIEGEMKTLAEAYYKETAVPRG